VVRAKVCAVAFVALVAAGCAPGAPSDAPSRPTASAPRTAATSTAVGAPPSAGASSGVIAPATPSPSDVEGLPTATLEGALEKMQASLSAGISVAVISSTGTWTGAAGVRDPASGAAVTPATIFAIGSITKTATAAALLHDSERDVTVAVLVARDLAPGQDPIVLAEMYLEAASVPGG
jgi:CubicO group peptidase (beta-lactamase class C family)